MNELDQLENRSLTLLREAYTQIPQLCMLWSIGKDSTVMLWLMRKAFFGQVPIPLIHIDTSFKIPEMITYRNRVAAEMNLTLLVGENAEALRGKKTFPDQACDRTTCCGLLKTQPLREMIEGMTPRKALNVRTGEWEAYPDQRPFEGVIVGIRADEEGTRAKERYFSPRGERNEWKVGYQPPEFWGQYHTEIAPGTHVRIHPLLDWTELNVWEYIERENIPMVSLYFNQGTGKRYRSLGCAPCTMPVTSRASTVSEIITELKSGQFANVAERSGRAQDAEDGGGLETLRKRGYM